MRDLTDGNADTCVGEVSVQLGGHVKVHKVARAQSALERRNAVGRFIIDADTCGAGKSVGHTRCRASSVASKHFSPQRVEFTSGRSWSDGLHHGLTGFGDNTPSTNECVKVLLLVNRHGAILWREP